MLKKAASFVLARHCRLTISAASATRRSLFFASRTSLPPRWTAFLNILCAADPARDTRRGDIPRLLK
jgi:hypothetical protein